MPNKQPKITTADIEIAVAQWFRPRTNLVVPNVWWGLLYHEADLFVVTRAGYAYEVEIKVSKADLLRDADKPHGHRSNLIKRLYFAVPGRMFDDGDFVVDNTPTRAGVLVVRRTSAQLPQVKLWRRPEANKAARALTDGERYQAARLGALRVFGLKQKIREATVELARLRAAAR